MAKTPLTRKERYHSFLKSDIWQLTRAIVRSREFGRCEICRKRCPYHGQAHHWRYQKNGVECWDDVDSIMWLCPSCHHDQHSPFPNLKQLRERVKNMGQEPRSTLLEIETKLKAL
jgi:hypothetical protein